MATILSQEQIKKVLPSVEALIVAGSAGFRAFSNGSTTVAPVQHLCYEKGGKQIGDTCVKSGFRHSEDAEYFVTKIASSHPNNLSLGLSPSSGVMLLFSQRTGKLVCLLQDDGYLTDLRTAVAGSLAVATFGPRQVTRIGIVGTGVQALFQLEMLLNVTECREVSIFGRDEEKLAKIQTEAVALGYSSVLVTKAIADIGASCNVIVTVTSAREPLLLAEHVRPGTLIVAMGSDGLGKQELDARVLSPDVADLVLVDSAAQCCAFGEASHGIQVGCLETADCIEIGQALSLLEESEEKDQNEEASMTSEQEQKQEHEKQRRQELYYRCNIRAGDKRPSTGRPYTVVFDSTGVAIQDVQIAEAVFTSYKSSLK